jgi:predicted GNAT family acetyltransferase
VSDAEHDRGQALTSSPIEVQRFDDAQAFLDEAGPYLAEHEAEHNLLFGIASTLVIDPDRFTARDTPYLSVVRRDGEVVAAALMTPPFKAVLSMTADPGAIPALVHDLERSRYTVPGISAPVEIAREFAEHWTARHGMTARRVMTQRIYRLEQVTPPTGVSGAMRVSRRADRQLLTDWVHAFLIEALETPAEREAEMIVDSALDTGSRTFYLWEDEGRPVSTAGVTGPTPNGIRVGPVYTPPDLRRRGYGSAITAAASQLQLDAGRRFVFLFTDLDNPTSNKIYQAIGYEPVIDIDQWTFEST